MTSVIGEAANPVHGQVCFPPARGEAAAALLRGHNFVDSGFHNVNDDLTAFYDGLFRQGVNTTIIFKSTLLPMQSLIPRQDSGRNCDIAGRLFEENLPLNAMAQCVNESNHAES
jgi:hypothetical protein